MSGVCPESRQPCDQSCAPFDCKRWTKTNARHSQDSPEWYTPKPFADAAREVFGGAITLDPASHPEANAIIGAESYYTEGMNGLILPWRGSVFVNPPGGLVAEFWRKLLDELRAGNINEAIWIGYSIEQLQTLQNAKAGCTPLDFPLCIPSKRIAFVENEAKRAARVSKLEAQGRKASTRSSPSHANFVCYVVSDFARAYPGERTRKFATVFQRFGQVALNAYPGFPACF